MRRLVVAASSLILVGCIPGGAPVAPPAAGPMLVIDVTNESNDDLELGYEFASDGWSGTGASFVPACRRETLPLSSIGGDYRVTVDGKAIAEGGVPAGAGEDASLVIRVRIGPDGEVEAAPPVVLRDPPTASAAIPGCG